MDPESSAAAARHYDPAYSATADVGADIVSYRDLAVAKTIFIRQKQ